ncbi:FtsK/SpoIIIE domain-containing protein [Rhodococcus sp. KRD162]|uniref:FtsK/SpoIIIE domain-containing protein n=1 Tax=Rhodococcus sp. KRD162 TaxID=2729725 RepID=UPI0019CFAD83|nr:FtsK/SpoIIIE domain-containing protein [Rhodococcus sp. KRD162]
MAQREFRSRPPIAPKLGNHTVELPDPLPQPEGTKGPILQRILPFLMIAMMLGFVGLMVTQSGSFSIYMLMMPMMMLMGLVSMLGGGGGGGTSELNADRRNYFLDIRERRTLAHRNGEAMFTAQEMSFPQPARLTQLIGSDDRNFQSMWAVWAKNPGGFVTKEGTEDEKAYRPYLAARIGRGTVELEPLIMTKELAVAEQIEPVTLGAYRGFHRTQRFVPGFPIAYHLGRSPFHSFEGADARVLPLVRAMIASLAFNHSPDRLELVLITDDPDGADWSAFKWLPHANDPTRMTPDGSARRIYRSLAEFVNDLPESVTERPAFRDNASSTTNEELPYAHMIVLIDLPDAEVRLPELFGVSGIDGITLFVVRAGVNEIPFAEDSALTLDADGKLSTPLEPALITADEMSTAEFDAFARKMSGYRTGRAVVLPGVVDTAPVSTGRTPYLKALGINDLESFDAYEFWKRTATDRERTIPIGDILDETSLLPTGLLADLNLSESSVGGSGPHGSMQGATGTGKSFLLQPMVLSLAAKYSPDQVTFILMDFKGGATFMGFEKLPHVLANITNLERDLDVLLRADIVIRGELNKRQEFFDQHKVPGILEYVKKRAKDPELPPLPELFVIIDEFGEFIVDNRDFLKLFSKITKVGRSMGVHLMLASQFIDQTVVGDIQNNLTFGTSLAVNSSTASRFVIGSDAAINLQSGQGHAYLRRSGKDSGLALIQGFPVDAPYIPSAAPTVDIGVSGADVDETTGTDNDVIPFNSISTTTTVIDTDGTVVTVDEPVVNPDHYAEERQALLEALIQYQDIQPRTLWQPTLTAPISFHGATLPIADNSGLRIRIGDLDDPYNHQRVPYTIRPEGAGAHIRVVGARGTGKSTTLQTIIASAAQTYAPTQVQFYLIDSGTKLQEMENYPNVGGRASINDDEMIDRIIAEFTRIVSLRTDEFERRRVANYAAYAASKIDEPVPGDHYGEMFLVIDGVNDLLDVRQEGIGGTIANQRTAALTKIAASGGSRGIHLVIAGEMESNKITFYNQFALWILHPSANPNEFTTAIRDRDIRSKYATIPDGQPGRVLEPTVGYHARIYVPQLDPIEPIPGSDPIAYDPKADYGDGIRALGERLASQYVIPTDDGGEMEVRAPKIITVPHQLEWATVWPIYQHALAVGDPRGLPLGAAADDLSLVTLPTDDGRKKSHMMIVGDPGSGKTTVVRSLLRSIIEQYTPAEAQIYLFDPGFTMMNESAMISAFGMLARYENQPARIQEAAEDIAEIIAKRQPDLEVVGPQEIAEGTWYTGPKIFVFIDPATTLTSTGSWDAAPTDALNTAIAAQQALGMSMGLQVFATETTNQYMTRRNGSAFYKALISSNADILLLSGTSTEPVAGSYSSADGKIMFARRRPGLGQLYSPSSNNGHPIVQTSFHPPFDPPAQES